MSEPIKVLWEELKPCPFCGRPAALDLESEVHLVVCQWCWARVSSHTEQDAVDRWNTRPVEVLHILGHKAARDELVQVRDELKQVRADRTIMLGLWLATVPSGVLPTLLPADPGDRDRLAAALDAVDLQSGTESHTAAVRAVIGRIVRVVAEMAGGARCGERHET